MGVIQGITRLGRQGYFASSRASTNNGGKGFVSTEIGRCMGGNRYLTTGFMIRWKRPHANFIMGISFEIEGWDSKSSRLLRQFHDPSPALFGME